ncbi:hypothetical protein GUJ93_ZPchr0010g8832 [Zizania palustris]|uniref:Uncharacterized protein n=1 Tax=Zizania palustris TaxID=103762 RepID=A0A8J5WB92_ZIZPA|nr:hypothetical protein GUJ93_ZPchr0010g8832 [Zizania palustris]
MAHGLSDIITHHAGRKASDERRVHSITMGAQIIYYLSSFSNMPRVSELSVVQNSRWMEYTSSLSRVHVRC